MRIDWNVGAATRLPALAIFIVWAAMTAMIGPAAAEERSAEDNYLAARDAAIAKFKAKDNTPVTEETDKAEEQARAGLEKQIRAVIGPISLPGFDRGKFNLVALSEGDMGFGVLDGLVFARDSGRTTMIVTTRTLFMRWLRDHEKWWEKEALPQQPVEAFRRDAFYTQAVDTDAAIVRFADIPLVAADTVASLVSRTQSETPKQADEVIVAAIRGERVFIAITKLPRNLVVASCSAERATAERKNKELTESASWHAKEADERSKLIEAMEQKTEKDFVQCFAARVPKQAAFATVMTAAKALYDKMPVR